MLIGQQKKVEQLKLNEQGILYDLSCVPFSPFCHRSRIWHIPGEKYDSADVSLGGRRGAPDAKVPQDVPQG
jgi:hypothetical protein